MNSERFEPAWDSLEKYAVPEWFRDAKFGIWAHWGPQCQPGRGDWYARGMYLEGTREHRDHLEQYGHPSDFGFKDVIHEWRAESWDPDALLSLYRKAGAEYFVAMANHHDNLDLWDSTYQSWNSVRVGPKRDVVAEWTAAAKRHGFRFGLSVHASHAWSWYEPAQGQDSEGRPFDGRLTAADGVGRWWEGLDPQEMYEQRHAPAEGFDQPDSIHAPRWDWGGGVVPPDEAYVEKFYRRTVELVDRFEPDLLYFDDTVLPLYPVSDVGLRIAAHYYNSNPEGVLNGKALSEAQKRAMVWDVERGAPNDLQPLPWQTCTCIGSWHYDERVFTEGRYKSAREVIHMLADVVSKNGNLLLSVPMRGDGTLDDAEVAIVEEIGAWMDVNREAIVGTRPWIRFGEGPASDSAKPLNPQGFNEGTGIPFSASDIRFTQKGNSVFAIVLGNVTDDVHVRSLSRNQGLLERPIASVSLLGSEDPIAFSHEADALVLHRPERGAHSIANAFRIELEP